MTEKFILDATAGFRMMWFDKKHPNCVYLDQRPECEPDIIGDFRDLKQFEDETFRLIVFDPPHIVKSKAVGNYTSSQVRTFGYLRADTLVSDMKKAFSEMWRVLKPFGILLFKWNNTSIPSNKLIDLAPEKPLIYQVTSNKDDYGSGKRRKNVVTTWFCFMKIPQ